MILNDEMMKVMFIIPQLGSGGAERVVANLCRGLSEYDKVILIFENIIKQDIDAEIISINSPASQKLIRKIANFPIRYLIGLTHLKESE